MAHNIYFSVCGEGYGHSSRDIAIGKELIKAGASVLMGSYGYVRSRLENDFDTVEIEREFEMVGNGGAFDLKTSMLGSKKTVLRFSKIISDEIRTMKDFNATCVVADGRSSAVFAAFKLGIPCVIISNITSLEPVFKECGFFLRLLGKPIEMTIKTTTALAENTLIPDFPPPHTVCLNTLSKNRHVMKKQSFIGPVIPADFSYHEKDSLPDIKSPFVLTLLGGHSYRLPIFNSILKTAHRFPGINFLIFTQFKSDSLPENVTVRDFAPDISPYIHGAKMIITQAGHSTAMEILAAGKPALIIPDRRQVEQESNAARMKELGIVETIDYDNLDTGMLYDKINLLLTDPGFMKNGMKYFENAKIMNGRQKAKDIILELSERIQCY